MSDHSKRLNEAFRSVDWNKNAEEFLKQGDLCESIAAGQLRLARWALQLEVADAGNPALAFVREVQATGHYVAGLIGLALYKPAAACMRSMFECALQYTYFRSHFTELATLNRQTGYYMSKSDLIDFHMAHTPEFSKLQNSIGLCGKIAEWYKDISRVTHGQLPGDWIAHKSLSEISPSLELCKSVVEYFCRGEEVIHYLFLCTAARELWHDFSSEAKQSLLKGIHGDVKSALSLDMA